MQQTLEMRAIQADMLKYRKIRATTQNMCITFFKLQDNKIDFQVGVMGSKKKPYVVDSCDELQNITCSCPDFQKREFKPICKHMLFIIHLCKDKDLFENFTTYTYNKYIKRLQLSRIRRLLMMKITNKQIMLKSEALNQIVTIERDDFCSICMCDLDGKIEKCSICKHVIHDSCLKSWWELSHNTKNSKCPYCKNPDGFTHIKNVTEDPWRLFDFEAPVEAPVAPPLEAPVEAPVEAPEEAAPVEASVEAPEEAAPVEAPVEAPEEAAPVAPLSIESVVNSELNIQSVEKIASTVDNIINSEANTYDEQISTIQILLRLVQKLLRFENQRQDIVNSFQNNP